MLKGKKILIGVTGGIAAYKTAILVRLLVKEGASVKVIMTEHAKKFITPLTLATLSKNPVPVEFSNPENGNWNSHVELGLWADLYLIAPATANTIGKMANGIADNLLLTSYLSARCKVIVAPSMDMDMLNHPATLQNIDSLRSRGNIILEPSTGELASGLSGKGRMAEPEGIVTEIKNILAKKKNYKPLKGLKLLVNAGPTREQIDPVRFLSNNSSGKMGIALADVSAECGADVELVLGPVDILPENRSVKVISVTSAEAMAYECIKRFPVCDIAILAAAVSDFTPETVSKTKIKRVDNDLIIKLKSTTDIAAELGKMKKKRQLLVGFALETDNELENANYKIRRKNLDFIVLNSLQDNGAGFGFDTNRITIIDKNNNIDKFELKSKEQAARDIIEKIVSLMQ